jgi:hypothetical protein
MHDAGVPRVLGELDHATAQAAHEITRREARDHRRGSEVTRLVAEIDGNIRPRHDLEHLANRAQCHQDAGGRIRQGRMLLDCRGTALRERTEVDGEGESGDGPRLLNHVAEVVDLDIGDAPGPGHHQEVTIVY